MPLEPRRVDLVVLDANPVGAAPKLQPSNAWYLFGVQYLAQRARVGVQVGHRGLGPVLPHKCSAMVMVSTE